MVVEGSADKFPIPSYIYIHPWYWYHHGNNTNVARRWQRLVANTKSPSWLQNDPNNDSDGVSNFGNWLVSTSRQFYGSRISGNKYVQIDNSSP